MIFIFQLYLSVNSGARLGLAEEVKALYRVAWEDSAAPDRGFRYLYLSPEDYSQLAQTNSVRAVLIDDEGEARYKITDIIGKVLYSIGFIIIFFPLFYLGRIGPPPGVSVLRYFLPNLSSHSVSSPN